MPTTSSPRASRRCAQCMPMKPATPVTRTLIAFRLSELDQLRVLHVAVHAADRDVHDARHAIEEAQPQDVELEEAHHRREEEVDDARAMAFFIGLAGGEGGVAVLAVEVGAEV